MFQLRIAGARVGMWLESPSRIRTYVNPFCIKEDKGIYSKESEIILQCMRLVVIFFLKLFPFIKEIVVRRTLIHNHVS